MATVSDMQKAKNYSDVRQYDAKHSLLNQLIREAPQEFYVDSDDNSGIVGLTHAPTGFRIHAPRHVIEGLELGSKAASAIGVGFGLPTPGGTVSKMLKPTSRLKGKLTNDTLKSDAAEDVMGAPNDMFKETRKFQARKANPGMKQAVAVRDLRKYTGYDPGFWYDSGTFSQDAERRMGNLISGAGLSAAGLAAIPALQYLFPERFKNKTKPLAALAVLGGMAAPWIATLPGTVRDISSLGRMDPNNYTDDYVKNMQQQSDIKAETLRQPPETRGAVGAVKAGSIIPMDLQLSKSHLADTLTEQWQRGYLDYGQAAGLMNRIGQQESKPWFTVRDLAHAAVGAGAGALAGTVAAKGIGMFMNLSPTEQKVMQGTGAALGTLINLGKLGI